MCAADQKMPPFPVDGLQLDHLQNDRGTGVHLTLREDLALTRIMPFRGQANSTADALVPWWEGRLPDAGCASWSGCTGLAWAGANCWMLIRPRGPLPETGAIASALEGRAAVSDASDGFLPLDLTGPELPGLLAKGCSLDLDRFEPGSSTSTQIAHTHLRLLRMDQNSFRLLVPASHVHAFVWWLEASAAEFGLTVRRCPAETELRKERLSKAV